MVRAGVKSNVMTASSAVDRVVESALAAAAVSAESHRLVRIAADEVFAYCSIRYLIAAVTRSL